MGKETNKKLNSIPPFRQNDALSYGREKNEKIGSDYCSRSTFEKIILSVLCNNKPHKTSAVPEVITESYLK